MATFGTCCNSKFEEDDFPPPTFPLGLSNTLVAWITGRSVFGHLSHEFPGRSMTNTRADSPGKRPDSPLARVRVWHLGLLVGFVAVAIADIQDHRRTEPFLIGLAGVGFAAYWVLGWLGWHFAGRLRTRWSLTAVLLAYLVAMAGLFLVATIAYLMVEQAYLGGQWRWW